SDVLVEGFFRYDDPLDVGPIERGARTGAASANSLYRDDSSASPIPFGSNAHELRIFLSGYNEGAVPADTLFPGWHAHVPDPGDATAVSVVANENITDAVGNTFDHFVQIAASAFVPDPAGVEPVAALTGPWINAWDVEPPKFGLHSEFEYSIVLQTDIATGLINRLDFFVHDDESLEEDWPDPAFDEWLDVLPFVLRHDPAYTFSPHPGSANNRIRGIRGSTLDYPGDGLDEFLAFSVEEDGVEPLRTDRNTGLTPNVENPLYGLITEPDDSYFRLNIASTGHPWGLVTDLWVSYDHTLAYITDLAGNLLPSAEKMLAIKQTPPRMNLALASVGDDKVYVKFSEPVFGDEGATLPVDETVLQLQPPTGPPIEFVSITTVDNGTPEAGDREFFFYLGAGQTVTESIALAAFLVPQFESIFDRVGNAVTPTDVHRVTDIGIGVVEPVWASDGIRDDTLGGVAESLRVFDGSGYLDKREITLQARIGPTLASSWPLTLHFDVDPDPSVFVNEFGYWVPSIVPGLSFFKDDDGLDESEVYNPGARAASPVSIQGQLRTYVIPGAELSAAADGASFQFHFRLGNIFTARLLNDDDPTTIVPWSFLLGGVIEQRGGVTIFNNVINPLENERTVITLRLPDAGLVTIQVMTLDGSLVRMVQRGRLGEGEHTFTWDGRNMGNREVARGMYFIRVVGPGIDEYRKVLVVK
ncbi:MAG: hemagglutinin, partial [Spirochaetaceae bacterium]